MNKKINKANEKIKDQTPENQDEKVNGKCEERLLKKIFEGLSERQKDAIQKIIIKVQYREGDLIFQEGSLSDGIYFICRGFVAYGKRLSEDPDRKRIFKLLGPGDILGEETIFGTELESRFGFARSIARTDLLFLEKTNLLRFLEDQPQLYRALCRNMTLHLQTIEEKLLQEGFLTTDRRLADLLDKIVQKQVSNTGDKSLKKCVKLSRKILAQILGVSRASITNNLKKLENKNLLTLKDEKICVESRENLIKFAASRSTNC